MRNGLKMISRNAQPPNNKLTKEQIENFHLIIEEFFGIEWLNCGIDNPITNLWKRKDFLASMELYYLSQAINSFKDQPVWLNETIKSIKDKDTNNQKGALFELIGLSYFKQAGMDITPLGNSSPGIDAEIKTRNENVIGISSKNYGLSSHYNEITRKIDSIYNLFINKLNLNLQAKLIIITESEYPNKHQFNRLEQLVESIIKKFNGRDSETLIEDNWKLILTKLNDLDKIATDHKSHCLIFLTPFHQNEHKNLTDKIDKAFENIVRLGKQETDKRKNILFIHLPITAPVRYIRKLVKEYFKNNQNGISGVLLYQPSYISTLNGPNSIYHFNELIIRVEFNDWINNNDPECIKYSFYDDAADISPISHFLTDGINDIHLEDYYIYQKGKIYIKHQFKDNSGLVSLPNLLPGIETTVIFESIISDTEKQTFGIQGIYPPSADLIII
ncbi:hypothetical protein AB3N58_10120 [Leptospira sp. WS60.C2]